MYGIKKFAMRAVGTYVALSAWYLIGEQKEKMTQQEGVIERQNAVIADLVCRDKYLVGKLRRHNVPVSEFDQIVLNNVLNNLKN